MSPSGVVSSMGLCLMRSVVSGVCFVSVLIGVCGASGLSMYGFALGMMLHRKSALIRGKSGGRGCTLAVLRSYSIRILVLVLARVSLCGLMSSGGCGFGRVRGACASFVLYSYGRSRVFPRGLLAYGV